MDFLYFLDLSDILNIFYLLNFFTFWLFFLICWIFWNVFKVNTEHQKKVYNEQKMNKNPRPKAEALQRG